MHLVYDLGSGMYHIAALAIGIIKIRGVARGASNATMVCRYSECLTICGYLCRLVAWGRFKFASQHFEEGQQTQGRQITAQCRSAVRL